MKPVWEERSAFSPSTRSGKEVTTRHLPTYPFSTTGYCGYSKRTSSSCPQNEGANENGWNIRPNDCSNVDSAWSEEEQQRAMIHCQRTGVIVQMYRGKTNAESLLRWNLIYMHTMQLRLENWERKILQQIRIRLTYT